MRIYIDFDDVLCETALAFTKIAKQMFGIDVPYREVQFFNLKKTFDLTDSQYEELMKAGHFPDNLLNYEETPGASETINKWVDKYGRENCKQDYVYNLTLEQLYGMSFDFAVEDSPAAFWHVSHFEGCRIAVFNRPWNIREELPDDRFIRCEGWKEVDKVFGIKEAMNT